MSRGGFPSVPMLALALPLAAQRMALDIPCDPTLKLLFDIVRHSTRTP